MQTTYIRKGRPKFDSDGWSLPDSGRIGIYVRGVDPMITMQQIRKAVGERLTFTYYHPSNDGRRYHKHELPGLNGDYVLDIGAEHLKPVLEFFRTLGEVQVTNYWEGTQVCHDGCRTAERKLCVCVPVQGRTTVEDWTG